MSLTVVRHRVNRGLLPTVNHEERSDVVVCDRHGTLGNSPIDDLEVVLVGGVPPADAIRDPLERFGEPPAAGAAE